jgi:inorganic phosphate transporter, PiT family
MLLMIAAVLIATLLLAFANGANDVSKGIGTLVGAGVSSYGRAVTWGALCTVAGGLTAAVLSQALVATFSGKGILTQPSTAPSFLLAIACGTIGWLIVATGTGLPVSTTHSLVGALVGAALVQSGTNGILWSALAAKVALPLAASPMISVGLMLVVVPILRPVLWRFERSCVCVEEGSPAMVTPEGMTLRQSLPGVTVGAEQSCQTATARVDTIDALHWISAGATSFFRGLNDTPKILAVGVAAATITGFSGMPLYAAVAVSMGLGSVIAGVRVTRTLAEKVTRISPPDGFTANVVTATLVGLASRFALPVSTTHVSSGAIIGVGMAHGGKNVRWGKVGEMGLAWLVTLPLSAVLAAVAAHLLR